ncbi:hypothetical protein [Yeosuana aromativorans]|nr:hypothetical protein [Yeosuana aromativorans]
MGTTLKFYIKAPKRAILFMSGLSTTAKGRGEDQPDQNKGLRDQALG